MAPRKGMPPLPPFVFSTLGPLPVSLSDSLEETDGALGITRFKPRTVDIASGLERATQWQTYWHEATHVALWDAGAHGRLTEEQAEAVCDALGTYLAAMVKAGCLAVRTPR